MKTLSLPLSAALLLTFLAGCESAVDGTRAETTSVVDSAGVRIVRSALATPADTVQAELLWEHGAGTSDYPFSAIGFGVVRDDSVVVVADSRNRELVAIRPGGVAHALLARSGQGPSEVGGARRVMAGSGNEVWLEDVLNAKLMRFVGDSLVETVGGADLPWDRGSLMPIGVAAGGELLMTSASYPFRFDEPWLAGSLAVFDVRTSSVDTVGVFDLASRTGDPPYFPFQPYGVVSVADGAFVTARVDLSRLTWRSAGGAVTDVFEWEEPGRFADEEDWEAFRAGTRSRYARPDQTEAEVDAQVDRVLADYALDTSQRLPLFQTIVGADNGQVWLVPFTPRQASLATGWRVATRGEDWLGVVRFERPLRLLYVRGGLLVGVHTDELGVQTVAVYRNPFGS